jgi:hypothetical protein
MKFTIRDALLLTVIVALALGWWLDRQQSDRPPPPAPTSPTVADRFELIPNGESSDKVLLFDPRTGQVWQRQEEARVTESRWNSAWGPGS